MDVWSDFTIHALVGCSATSTFMCRHCAGLRAERPLGQASGAHSLAVTQRAEAQVARDSPVR